MDNNNSPPITANDRKPVNDIVEKWKLLPLFLQVRGIMRQHTDSFDSFINIEMKKIIQAKSNKVIRSDVDPQFFLSFEDIFVGNPSLADGFTEIESSPQLCRLRDSTYSAPILVNIKYLRGRKIVTGEKIEIGRLPIMIKSSKCVLHNATEQDAFKLGECPYDPGGYFIIRGVEKIILAHEQPAKNCLIIESSSKAFVNSSTRDRKSRSEFYFKHDILLTSSSCFSTPVNLIIIMKACVTVTDFELMNMICGDDDVMSRQLLPTLYNSYSLGVTNQSTALQYLLALKTTSTLKMTPLAVITEFYINHISNLKSKYTYLCYICRRILSSQSSSSSCDDRDNYTLKRIELSGSLLSLLFEDLFKKYSTDLKRQIDASLSRPNRAEAFDVIRIMRSDSITYGFIHSISTGNWILRRFKVNRAGVSQVLSRLSYLSAVGMISRVQSQFEKTRKVSGPRALQSNQFGYLCPSDTPEGESCGLVKNMALTCHVTDELNDNQQDLLLQILIDFGLLTNFSSLAYHWSVVHNGLVIGVIKHPIVMARKLLLARRHWVINRWISIMLHEDHKILYLSSDMGRTCRPLIIVSNSKSLLTASILTSVLQGQISIERLCDDGIVEYIDVIEENNCLIATREAEVTASHTHLEIDPSVILGVVVSLVPYPHHNQSPRNTYQCAMGKQAIGTTCLNQYQRTDTLLYSLVYPQKPIITSQVMDLIHFNELSGGQNISLAVMSYSGYDIEDAIVLNKASVDRGFGRCWVMRKYETGLKKTSRYSSSDTVVKHTTANEEIRIPPLASTYIHGDKDVKFKRFSCLDPLDGLVQVGETVSNGCILANKYSPLSGDEVAYRPSPLTYRSSSSCVIDRVVLTRTSSSEGSLISSNIKVTGSNTPTDMNDTIIKIMTRECRRPQIGDKFSSRHGQKGVVGLEVSQSDVPFSFKDGIVPDLIMNPHGFPSRMTIGKMIELVVGKAATLSGSGQDYGTAFGEESKAAGCVEAAAIKLIQSGFAYSGRDVFISGTSGLPLLAYIFCGPIFYQKLKHMVQDKMHARSRGPRAPLTRQPTEGRSRDGGLRLGEMERDCLVGYGASNLLMERLMYSSDPFLASVCESCGLLSSHSNWCKNCSSSEFVCNLRLPYACKLLFQELQSMNIVPRLKLKKI